MTWLGPNECLPRETYAASILRSDTRRTCLIEQLLLITFATRLTTNIILRKHDIYLRVFTEPEIERDMFLAIALDPLLIFFVAQVRTLYAYTPFTILVLSYGRCFNDSGEVNFLNENVSFFLHDLNDNRRFYLDRQILYFVLRFIYPARVHSSAKTNLEQYEVRLWTLAMIDEINTNL